ncbi:hypothetical protein CFN78_07090 [Amycolatopsis antarctica]|uniref:Uncharacterized protein n=1 Tax=Amycolatopsis antarctica TaxID=1854586 RepID=A0A263D6P7_9PSEU|nr:hypothetical protein [Amycolatopsis antarctica]OZM74194.1 hypothetical protein CFN78_07090 [Amycolatopsis antarctica]
MSRAKQIRGVFGLAGSVGSAASAFSTVRSAKDKKDTLVLVNAGASAVAAATGVLLAVRRLRKGGDK